MCALGPTMLLSPPSLSGEGAGPRGASRPYAPRERRLGDGDPWKLGDSDMLPSPGTVIAAAMVYSALTSDSQASEAAPSEQFQPGGGDFGGGGSSGSFE